MTEDKKELEILLTTYIALKKNQAQCTGFIDGFEAAIEYLRKGQSLPIDGVISRLPIREVLNYEIHSHWLASWIGFEWGQDLMGKYFAWKVRKKYNRYLVSLEERKRVLNGL